jgi:hypothetical protein
MIACGVSQRKRGRDPSELVWRLNSIRRRTTADVDYLGTGNRKGRLQTSLIPTATASLLDSTRILKLPLVIHRDASFIPRFLPRLRYIFGRARIVTLSPLQGLHVSDGW